MRRSPEHRALLLFAMILGLGPAAAAAQARIQVAPLRDFRVEITSPEPGEIAASRMELRARVSADRPDEILFVEFEVDGRVLFADSTAPYELIWNTREVRGHTVVVRAYGPAGNVVEDRLETAAPPGAAFVSRVDRVEVYVHLDDRSEIEPDSAEFTVLESGVAQQITAVDRTSDLPVAVGFMLDSSHSMVNQLSYAIDTAGTFIDQLMQLPHDKAFVMTFADLPAVLQQFTNDRDRLVTSLELINSGRYTRLYDSIVAAANQFEGHEGRRALVMLSDGRDSDSDARLEDAIAAAQRYDVAIYPIAVGLSARYFTERWVLRRMASQTGGEMFDLRTLDNPQRVYESIARDLREQFRITYSPSRPGGAGEWREIEILVQGSGNRPRTVRARPGYWAQ